MSFNYRNVNSYVKNQSLIDQMSANLSSKSKADKTSKGSGNSLRLIFISSKLQSGKKLSYGEMQYLKKENPALHAKAVSVCRQRKDLESKLKLCKSKSEVRALQMSATQAVAGTGSSDISANNGSNAGDIAMVYNALKDEWTSFVSKSSYKKLPEKKEFNGNKKLCDKQI